MLSGFFWRRAQSVCADQSESIEEKRWGLKDKDVVSVSKWDLVGHWRILAFSLIKMRNYWRVLSRAVRWSYEHFNSITLAIMGSTNCGWWWGMGSEVKRPVRKLLQINQAKYEAGLDQKDRNEHDENKWTSVCILKVFWLADGHNVGWKSERGVTYDLKAFGLNT